LDNGLKADPVPILILITMIFRFN